MYSHLLFSEQNTFPFLNIRLIPDTRLAGGCTVCVASHSSPQAARAHAYSGVNDQGYYDLQEALATSPKTNYIPVCLMRSCFLRYLPPPPPPPQLQVMLWIFINVFHSTAAGLSHHR